VLGSGETLRWEFEIDGLRVPDVDLRLASEVEHPDVIVMSLVRADEELAISAWSAQRYPGGPAAVSRTLGEIRRALSG
jgi:hypothetical protein